MDWLPENHAVCFLLDLAAALDLGKIQAVYRPDDGAAPGRVLPGAAQFPEDREGLMGGRWFRLLTGKQQTNHSRTSEILRRPMGVLLRAVHPGAQGRQKARLVSLGHAPRADATSERQLEGEMGALMRRTERIDAQGDGQIGKGKRGDELPEELQRRSNRLEWSRKAKARPREAADLDQRTMAAAAEIDLPAGDAAANPFHRRSRQHQVFRSAALHRPRQPHPQRR